jgi:CubicO group peptidase (beta-lactamase class C family)
MRAHGWRFALDCALARNKGEQMKQIRHFLLQEADLRPLLTILTIVIGALVTPLVLAAHPAGIAGEWAGAIEVSEYGKQTRYAGRIKLEQNGAIVSGSLGLDDKRPQPILHGRLNGSKLTFGAAICGGLEMEFHLRVTGDELSGYGLCSTDLGRVVAKVQLSNQEVKFGAGSQGAGMNRRLAMAGLVTGVLATSLGISDAAPGQLGARNAGQIRPPFTLEVHRLLVENAIPSVSIAHIEEGKLVFIGAYGLQAPGVSATTRTLYNIASLSKPMSAEVILRLASKGKLTLDEPMYLYWTDPDIANDERRKLLTPRLALSHQTGFPNWRRQTGRVLIFKHNPGETYGYSGEGYEYVARFAQQKMATDFESLAQHLVLDPLGMTETAYTRRPWFDGRIALPTDAVGKTLEPEIADKWTASDLVYTTPNDYAKFVLSVMRGRDLTPAISKERSRIQIAEKSALCSSAKVEGCPDAAGFGLGWEVFIIADETYLTHDGSDDGVATFVYINLTRKTGTVIFTNSSNGQKIVLPILDLLGKDQAFVECLRRNAC